MPETKGPKDDASKRAAARVRDNQRRARERHKEYFADLQRKVSEYEKQGVQATLAMQQSARSVAFENDRLRLLLKRKGVADEEVTAFLRDCDETGSRPEKMRKKKHVDQNGDGKARKAHNISSVASSPVSQPLPADFTNYQPDGLTILANVSAQQDCCGGQTKCTDPKEPERSLSLETLPQSTPLAEMAAQMTPHSGPLNDIGSSTTMSCLAAAQIVADLQGHGDRERARASLGCCDEGECTVKNTAVFQAMDTD